MALKVTLFGKKKKKKKRVLANLLLLRRFKTSEDWSYENDDNDDDDGGDVNGYADDEHLLKICFWQIGYFLVWLVRPVAGNLWAGLYMVTVFAILWKWKTIFWNLYWVLDMISFFKDENAESTSKW